MNEADRSIVKITSVNKTVWHLLWGPRKRTTIYLLPAIFISLALSPFSVNIIGSFILPLLTLFFILRVVFMHLEVQGEFMKEFGQANNMSYLADGDTNTLRGRLFEIGTTDSMTNVLSGEYQGHPLRLFNHIYTIGSGKKSRSQDFTILEITFPKTKFPYIRLLSKTMSEFYRYHAFGKQLKTIEIPLEDEYKDSFRLFCSENYEIEVLQIFTSDFLKFLEEKSGSFSIEFTGDKMNIYDDRTISNIKDLTDMYETAKKIFDTIGPLLNRLHDDFNALHPYYEDKVI